MHYEKVLSFRFKIILYFFCKVHQEVENIGICKDKLRRSLKLRMIVTPRPDRWCYHTVLVCSVLTTAAFMHAYDRSDRDP